MSRITEQLNTIRNGVYGRDVRSAIADSLDSLEQDVLTIEDELNNFDPDASDDRLIDRDGNLYIQPNNRDPKEPGRVVANVELDFPQSGTGGGGEKLCC